MAQITYANKVTLNENTGVDAVNKCRAVDMNEIKSVVNENYTEQEETKTNLEDLTTYSTQEKTVGKWIDGKPIYRKVMTGSKVKTVDLTFPAISDIETVIKLEGYLKANTGGSVYSLPYYGGSEIYTNIEITTAGSALIRSAVSDYSNGSIIVIVEYTKTTDIV